MFEFVPESVPDDPKSLRDRARQCRALAEAASDEPMRSMLERMAAEFDEEATKIEKSGPAA